MLVLGSRQTHVDTDELGQTGRLAFYSRNVQFISICIFIRQTFDRTIYAETFDRIIHTELRLLGPGFYVCCLQQEIKQAMFQMYYFAR